MPIAVLEIPIGLNDGEVINMNIYYFQNTYINFLRPTQSLGIYIYFYLRTDGTPYYVGKGTGKRAWNKQHNINLPTNKSLIIIAETNLTEIGALALERRYISWYGRKDIGTGILRNMTDGGEGTSGFKHSTNTKILMSIAKKGKSQSIEHAKSAATARIGIKHSLESRHARSLAVMGDKHPMYGKTHTQETIDKISKASSGRKMTDDTKRKLSKLNRKVYEFISPADEKYLTDNISEFCIQHKLSVKDMYKVASGTHRSKSGTYKGWKCSKMT